MEKKQKQFINLVFDHKHHVMYIFETWVSVTAAYREAQYMSVREQIVKIINDAKASVEKNSINYKLN